MTTVATNRLFAKAMAPALAFRQNLVEEPRPLSVSYGAMVERFWPHRGCCPLRRHASSAG